MMVRAVCNKCQRKQRFFNRANTYDCHRSRNQIEYQFLWQFCMKISPFHHIYSIIAILAWITLLVLVTGYVVSFSGLQHHQLSVLTQLSDCKHFNDLSLHSQSKVYKYGCHDCIVMLDSRYWLCCVTFDYPDQNALKWQSTMANGVMG